MSPRSSIVAVLLLCAFAGGACTTFKKEPPLPPPPPPGTPLTPEPQEPADEEPLPVKKVLEQIVVAAWAEPKGLPPGGGQAQILVRVQKRGGRLSRESRCAWQLEGALFSRGKVLVTDGSGRTRDRLNARRPPPSP